MASQISGDQQQNTTVTRPKGHNHHNQMRTETITREIFTFEELSEEAKQKAIDKNRDINVDHGWWYGTYDDAENVELKIKSFDTGRASECDMIFIESAQETAAKILKEHGSTCDTYATAQKFEKQWAALVEKYSDGKDTDKVSQENSEEFDDEADDLEKEFLNELSNDYLKMLRSDYEYLQEDDAIAETLTANECEFLKDGTPA